MDKKHADDVVELNTEETEQVVGGTNGTPGQPTTVEIVRGHEIGHTPVHGHEEIIHRDGRIIERRW